MGAHRHLSHRHRRCVITNKKLVYIKEVVLNQTVEVICDGKKVKIDVLGYNIFTRVIPAIIAAQELLPTSTDYMFRYGNPSE